MTEINHLKTLRAKLVNRRRTLVAGLQDVPPGALTGDSIIKIQSAVDAVDRAIEDELACEHDMKETTNISRGSSVSP